MMIILVDLEILTADAVLSYSCYHRIPSIFCYYGQYSNLKRSKVPVENYTESFF